MCLIRFLLRIVHGYFSSFLFFKKGRKRVGQKNRTSDTFCMTRPLFLLWERGTSERSLTLCLEQKIICLGEVYDKAEHVV